MDRRPQINRYRTLQLALSLPKSKPSNSKKQTWTFQPLSFRQSRILDACISTQTLSTTSSSSTISHGIFHFTEVGTLGLRRHFRRATTAPVRALVGPSATDSGRQPG